jgi:hypothetical protein
MALTIANVLGGATSDIVAGATGAAPAANALIVDSGLLPAGDQEPVVYLVSVLSGQVGTPDTNYANILVNVGGSGNPVTGGTTYGPLTSLPATQSGGAPQRFRVTIPIGGAHILICVGNTAGGAGAIYVAGITVSRLSDKFACI